MARGIRIDRSEIITISGDSVIIVLSGCVDTAPAVSASMAGIKTITSLNQYKLVSRLLSPYTHNTIADSNVRRQTKWRQMDSYSEIFDFSATTCRAIA